MHQAFSMRRRQAKKVLPLITVSRRYQMKVPQAGCLISCFTSEHILYIFNILTIAWSCQLTNVSFAFMMDKLVFWAFVTIVDSKFNIIMCSTVCGFLSRGKRHDLVFLTLEEDKLSENFPISFYNIKLYM